jgi:UDP-N-acetyl-2-amino-2-deoxyglucuronate dehydrogenase
MKRRIAIVGLGMAVTPHVRSLIDLKEGVELAYAFSPTQTRREAFARQFAIPLCDSLDAILNDRSVEAVEILTPPNTHHQRARRAAG